MSLEIVWLSLLGLLLAGYFVLGGYDYGVQMLQPVLGGKATGGNTEQQRRAMLGALGPFFLGNEVWLVAFGGVLFGAFPILEGTLLAGMYPLIAAILSGIVVGNAAVQLRSRADSQAGRQVWDALVVTGGVVPAVGWGLLVGVLLHGVALDSDGAFQLTAGTVLHPFVLLCGLTTGVLFLAHGAAFLALRTRGEMRERASTLARPLLLAAITLAVIAAVAGFLSEPVRAGVNNPLVAVALVAAMALALSGAFVQLSRDAGRTSRAFAATCIAAAIPVVLVGGALFPYTLTSTVADRFSMTVGEAAADTVTLQLLGWFALPLIPLILIYQAWNWWAFRGRVDQHTPTYF